MKPEISKFRVDVVRIDRVPDLPGSWTNEEYRQILEACDFDWPDDFAEEEMADYAIIALLDFEPEEAAAIVLNIKLKGRLSPGQVKNLAEEMQHEKTWEEYQDMSLHRSLFECHVLLNQAFPKDFPDTDIARSNLEVTPMNRTAREQLEHTDASLVVRLLADGMKPYGLLNRFFGDALNIKPFKEAPHIVWKFTQQPLSGGICSLKVYGSWYWITPLLEVSDYESEAFCDLQPA